VKRPKVKIERDLIDWVTHGLTMAFLVFLILSSLYYISMLPDNIPTHFNVKGVANNYSSKYSLWLTPAIALSIYILMVALNRIPEVFNYPIKITPENARKQYTLGTKVVRVVNLDCMLLFSYVHWGIIQAAQNKSGQTAMWPALLLILLCIITPTIYYWRKMAKAK